MIFSFVIILASCSKSEANEEVMYGLESDLQAAHKDVNMSAKAKYYTADLSALNNSGVSGTAELVLEGNELTVTINATGLVPDMVHPQHIHGFKEDNRNAKCPPASADEDGDGLVELGEGLPFYGPVLLALDPFPTAPDGEISFVETYNVGDLEFPVTPLQNRVIVLHGKNVEGEYVATLPVACGQIQPAQGKNK
jgi:hypothetical protein